MHRDRHIDADNINRIILYNLDGQLISGFLDINNDEIGIDIELNSGLYLLKIINKNGIISSKKLVIAK